MLADLQHASQLKTSAVTAAQRKLKDIHILLADADPCLSHVTIYNLRAMGFSRITYARSRAEIERTLRTTPVHVLVTERTLPDIDGLDLVRRIRSGAIAPSRELPIVMLTGRGELPDVVEARDAGITEFVVKPFSTRILYSRIEQIVDHPRGFLIADSYTGPDRRRKGTPPAGMADRRTTRPLPCPSLDAALAPRGGTPVLVAPSPGLRKLMATREPLSRIITPDMVEKAQSAMESMADSYMHWINADLALLQESRHRMQHEYATYLLIKTRDAALSLKSRAGTFGFTAASEVARLLFLFLGNDFQPAVPRHYNVIDKHIDALKVLFSRQLAQAGGAEQELVHELKRLAISQR